MNRPERIGEGLHVLAIGFHDRESEPKRRLVADAGKPTEQGAQPLERIRRGVATDHVRSAETGKTPRRHHARGEQ